MALYSNSAAKPSSVHCRGSSVRSGLRMSAFDLNADSTIHTTGTRAKKTKSAMTKAPSAPRMACRSR